MRVNYYNVLGLETGASVEEIRQSFKKLARQWHPDHNKSDGAESVFKSINEAYHALMDPAKRALYEKRDAQKTRSRHFERDVFSFEKFQNGKFEELDVNLQMTVSMKDLYNGVDMRLTYVRRVKGPEPGSPVTEKEESVIVRDLWRYASGECLEFEKLGHDSEYTKGLTGRLYVWIEPEVSSFMIEGADLRNTVLLSLVDMLGGRDVTFDHADGQKRVVVVPPCTPPGAVFKVAGLGLITEGGKRGDLYVETRLDVKSVTREVLESVSRQATAGAVATRPKHRQARKHSARR